MGIVSWKLKRFFDDVIGDLWGEIDGKIGCAFSSSGGWGGGNEVDYTGNKFTLHYGAVVAGEPRTEAEREACLRLGERLAQFVAVLYDGKTELIGNIRNFPGKFPW